MAGKIKDHGNGSMAVDSYHRYKEDVRIMKEMGLDAYRLSISWSRILPRLKPFVTLFHWDLPQALEDEYGGFLSPKIVDDFQDYAELCFRTFGNRVKHWITLNEPWSYSMGGFMDPLTTGDYPRTMRSLVKNRLPKFSKEQSKLLNGSFDFIGLNYYTAKYAANVPNSNTVNVSYMTDSHANLIGERNGIPIGPKAASDWLYVYPRGIRDLLLYTKRKYNNPIIYITENGNQFVNSVPYMSSK
ncbi:hypothetical protein F0562_001533 [Nyssa sinensis]|uniref:Beta-glucosidase n=1 Tax=Nyssa sinensis TaxID=561372 RepID=A0A5J5C3Y1_9ASTE|nr:hypothetical protein F0562_001533 [Nyssa sinensis]